MTTRDELYQIIKSVRGKSSKVTDNKLMRNTHTHKLNTVMTPHALVPRVSSMCTWFTSVKGGTSHVVGCLPLSR